MTNQVARAQKVEKMTNLEASENPIGFTEAISEMVSVDWLTLVDHRTCVQLSEPLERVYEKFRQADVSFMAVLDKERVIGLCARHEIGMQLGSQYGFSLFGKAPVRDHLVALPLLINPKQLWADVLQRVFSRTGASFNQDVLLVDDRTTFLGLISVQTLVRLQTRLLMQSIAQLEQKQAEISRRNQQMTEDLRMAREMQLAMLPRTMPTIPPGVAPEASAIRVLSHYAPLGLVSGDFFEILPISDTAIAVLIADVMGHGVQAALVMAMMRALIQDHSDAATDPGEFLTALNRNLCEILEDSSLPTFASAFSLVIDFSAGELRYANAGHPCPIHFHHETGRAVHLDCEKSSNGGVLGVRADVTYRTGKAALKEGDAVLLFTDGLFEIRGEDGDILGQDRLFELAAANMTLSGEVLLQELINEVQGFSPQRQFEDDVCLVTVEIADVTFDKPV
ncbi:PP2C family protein-serine/threonine phosphatase [Methylocaldum sp.]|uniref:PP2C family protein-serine/threonine phosphatase n=1 Tax=Methylocaldum sp. TaxID=1969727 RepID=UPI002D7806D0|nr:SpoIIE family protein phosphatase [Methylocaldum sp.]